MHQAESNKPSHCHGQIRRHARASRRCRGLASNGAWRISDVACARIYLSACRARGLPARSCARFFIVMRALGLHIGVGVLMLLCRHMRAADFCAVHAFMLLRGTCAFHFHTMHPYFTAARFVLSRLCVAHVLLLLSSTCVPDFARHVCSCLRAEHALLLLRGTYTFPFHTMHPYFTAVRYVLSRLRTAHALLLTCDKYTPYSARHMRSHF